MRAYACADAVPRERSEKTMNIAHETRPPPCGKKVRGRILRKKNITLARANCPTQIVGLQGGKENV